MGDDTQKTRFMDLLADRALFGLSEKEQQELERLEPQFADVDPDEMERIVALIESSSPPQNLDQMPPAIKDKVLKAGERFNTGSPDNGSVVPEAASDASPAKASERRGQVRNRGWGRDILIAVLASAAALLLGALATWDWTVKQTPSQNRTAFIASNTEIVKVSWTPTDKTKNYSGDICWSDDLQKGFMTFEGLPKNDPAEKQYQLWIFAAGQDERFPVDGGVFNVGGSGKTVVEIKAKLPVASPSMFAITIEKPGGVVVSDRSRLPLLAQVKVKVNKP